MVEGVKRGKTDRRTDGKKEGERRKPRGINLLTGYVSDGQRETQNGRGERKMQRDRRERGRSLDNLLGPNRTRFTSSSVVFWRSSKAAAIL
jgi:hypothetical protein